MVLKVICIWSLFFVYGIESQDVMNRIPPRQIAHYDSNNNLEFFPAIVGGIPANEGDFSSHVSVQTRTGHHICGGTLIDLDYVLTSAHCVVNMKKVKESANNLRVMGDDLTITRNGSPKRQIKNVLHIFEHPKYEPYTAENDIAILKIESFTETATLKTTRTADESPKAGMNCTLAGWGSQKEGSKPNPLLFKANVTITDMAQCNASYAGQLKDTMFCAKGKGQDSCTGDSGGSLHCGPEGLVYGIVSFGNGCDDPVFPGVYTDVAPFATFIDETYRTVVPDVPYAVTETSYTPTSDKKENKTDAPGSATHAATTFSLSVTLSALIIYYFN